MRTEALKRIALGILCFAALAACGADKTVTNKELGFQISFPETYSASSSLTNNIVFADSTPNGRTDVDGITVMVTITNLKERESLRSFFTIPWHWAQLKGSTLTDIDVLKLDGHSMLKLSVIMQPPDEDRQRIYYYTAANGRGYTIRFSGRKVEYDKYAKDIDAIVKSFKLIEAK